MVIFVFNVHLDGILTKKKFVNLLTIAVELGTIQLESVFHVIWALI